MKGEVYVWIKVCVGKKMCLLKGKGVALPWFCMPTIKLIMHTYGCSFLHKFNPLTFTVWFACTITAKFRSFKQESRPISIEKKHSVSH